MSDFKEYKPVEPEYNVQAAVENLRKAYWSNETKKVAKHYTEAEDIIISAICHHHYTVCKETTEGDLISRSDLKTQLEVYRHTRNYKSDEDEAQNDLLDNILEDIDNAPPVPQVTVFTENADEKAVADLKAELENVIKSRPKGEWTVTKLQHGEDVTCPFCNARPTKSEYGYYLRDNFCHECGADMRKGGAE